ncbi:hypothetical protein [Phormidium sp. CCY1219]|uniref:hypothetical protein n=1 Tax=Phormidium sp. CCY1219 TaxID=2886104 RepID=UPI002D1EFC09|nr:hypothetical protein [Phormidium sp. CCY1219]MEB3826390.1 hypothetical protein [Phormidium sp. CCY1219]
MTERVPHDLCLTGLRTSILFHRLHRIRDRFNSPTSDIIPHCYSPTLPQWQNVSHAQGKVPRCRLFYRPSAVGVISRSFSRRSPWLRSIKPGEIKNAIARFTSPPI